VNTGASGIKIFKGKIFMLKSVIKKYIKDHPKIDKMYKAYIWKRIRVSDFLITYIFKSKHEALTPFGFTLIARNYSANRAMLKGIFELGEVEIIKRYTQEADVFVDVGANIGYYTCLARSLSKYAVAFEPQQQNLEGLYASLDKNGWTDTEVFPIGLSNNPGVMTLYGASGPSASLIKKWGGFSGHFKKSIPVNTMDNLLGERFSEKKIFIKIDVEGAEYGVLKGAIKTLNRYPRPTWYIEVCLGEYYPGKLNPYFADTFTLFWDHGYEVRVANKEKELVTDADIRNWIADKKTKTGEFNYLFIPKV
jgi:FkbM family methyltransferase